MSRGVRAAALCVALGLALACRAGAEPAAALDASAADPRATKAPSYAADVAPLLLEHCAACHRPNGAGPFSLLTYEEARKRAVQIARVTRDRYMPPWLPEPGYGRFAGERRLTDEQIAILDRWAAEGAAPGDLSRAPHGPAITGEWHLGEPDLVVTLEETYTLKAEPGDVFRNFVLPVPLDRTRYVRSLEFRPDNPEVVHHATIAVDRTPRSRYHDRRDPEPGYGGMINTTARRPDGHLLGWIPGKVPFEGRDDIAWRLDPGTDLVVQLHLQPSGKPESVRPSLGLYFARKTPTRTPFLLRLGSQTLDIPAGEADYVIADTYVLPVDVEVLGLVPHAHYLCRTMEAHAVLPDGTRARLLRIPAWDFDWQDEYRFADPVSLPKGSALTMRFTYDNSRDNVRNPHHPPRRAFYGPNTLDEMGDLWVQVLPARDAELDILRQDFEAREWRAVMAGMRHRLEHEPGDNGARNEMGEWLVARNLLDEGIQQFREVLRREPEHALARSNLASALHGKGELEAAEREYRAALRLEPDLPELHYNLGQVLKLQGRPDEAIECFERALALRPGLAAAHFALGTTFMHQGRLEHAERSFRAALASDPEDAGTYNNLGTVLAVQGRVSEAVEAFRHAVALQPDHASAHFNLARVLVQTGRLDEALEHVRATIEIDPGHVQARQFLDRARAAAEARTR